MYFVLIFPAMIPDLLWLAMLMFQLQCIVPPALPLPQIIPPVHKSPEMPFTIQSLGIDYPWDFAISTFQD